MKTSSRKPENVIKFGASQVGKIYGKAAKEHMNSLKHVVRTTCCSQPWHRPGYNRLGIRQLLSRIWHITGQQEASGCDAVSLGQAAGWKAVPFVISCTTNKAGLFS